MIKKYSELKKDCTRTPEFKKWFEGSKTVNSKGEPLIFYHGTHKDFSSFELRGGAIAGMFSTDPEKASRYAQYQGGRVIPVYLCLRNPFKGAAVNIKELKEKGFDGILTRESGEGNHINAEVFSKDQIKSAMGNSGDFDPSNPEITK